MSNHWPWMGFLWPGALIFKPSCCNLFEDLETVDFINGYPIFKCVAEMITWYGSRIVALAIVVHQHSPSTASSWWRHFLRYWPFVWGILPVTGEFPTQRPVMRNFDVFFDLCLNKRLSKQWRGWWFEMPLHPLWRHCNLEGWWMTWRK